MRGMTVVQRYWGKRYAKYKLTVLNQIAKQHHVALPNVANLNVFDQLCSIAIAIEQAGITPCQYIINKKGDKASFYWEPETKGIDDYFLSIR